MKWVKVAIGAVIAIISIGIIATSVHSMTQEKVRKEVVTFELLTETTVTSGTWTKLLEIENDVNVTINNVKGSIVITNNENFLSLSVNLESYGTGDVYYGINIYNDDTYEDGGFDYSPEVNDIIEITFELTTPAQLTGITATLILLTPLIFAGGVLAYLLNKQEL